MWWSVYVEVLSEIPGAQAGAKVGLGDEIANWLQLIVQGGAMALLTVLLIKAPGWIDNLVSRILDATGNMQKEVVAGFQSTLKDLRTQGQQTINMLEAQFHQRNEALRVSIDNQSRQLSQEMREIVKLVEAIRHGRSRRPPSRGDKDDKDIN